MPRINIEDEWFDDPRRSSLIEKIGEIATDGLALKMFRLAQTYFRVGKLLPTEIFDRVPHSSQWEMAGLAERQKDGVYIKGQRDRFDWLKKRSEAGTLGGKSPKKSDDAPSKQNEANESKRKQVEASSSSSSSNTNTNTPENKFSETDLAALWNEKRGRLPKVRKLSPSRLKKIKARLNEEPDLSYWELVFQKVQASPFLRGDKTKWKCSFSWLMENSENHLKVFEGNYDDPNSPSPAGPLKTLADLEKIEKDSRW